MDLDVNFMLHILNRQSKETDAIYKGLALKLGLSESEFWILYMLADIQDDCSQRDICRELSLSRQTINSAIQNLCRKELLFLERSKDSGRSKKNSPDRPGQAFYCVADRACFESRKKSFLEIKLQRKGELYAPFKEI